MTLPFQTRAYEKWAPVVARIIFGLQFLLGALFKVIGHGMEVAQTAAAGWPLPELSVDAAFVLEVVAGLMLVFGWRTRAVAFVLALYTLLLALVFYRHVSDPMIMGEFVSHLVFIAGLLYVSVYGDKRA